MITDPAIGITLVFAALILVIVISTKKKVNGGVCAIFAAFLVGVVLCGKTVTSVINYWPLTVMFILISTTLFFNIARENGTMEVLTQKLLYKFRKVTWAFPFIVFAINFIVAAGGAGSIAPQLLMSALIWPLSMAMGMNIIVLMVASWGGATSGGGIFWSSEGVNRLAFYTEYGGPNGVSPDAVYLSVVEYSLVLFIALLSLTVIWYLVFRGWKVNKANVDEIFEDKSFDPIQKKTLILIGAVILCILVPAVFKLLLPNPVTKFIAGVCDIQVVCVVAFLVAVGMKLCDEKKIISTIPIGLILVVCGYSMLIKIAIDFNLPEIFANVLLNFGLPLWILPATFLIFSCIISLFSNFAVIYPILMPLVPLVAMATGMNSMALFAGMALGSCSTALSPFSMAGACQLSGCDDPDKVAKMTPRLFALAAANAVILALVTCPGVLNFLPDPMAIYPMN